MPSTPVRGPDASTDVAAKPGPAATSLPPSPLPRRSRGRTWALRAVSIVGGLAVGLVLAEWAFRARDDGAFPHLNVYVADAKRGVRLQPGAIEKVRFGDNPVTTVRINEQGYRGADWPSPSSKPASTGDKGATGGEILVVGDSQTFGLGVEEGESFSAQLATLRNAAVLNAGVPTYGPVEYQQVLEEVLAKRQLSAVIYVINVANDLFEAKRPDVERHTVWDGWAVRRETAPEHVTDFPGRSWLYRDSHLFYAMRGWVHRGGPLLGDESRLASEGSWRDLAFAGVAATHERAEASAETQRLGKLWQEELRKANNDAAAARRSFIAAALSDPAHVPHNEEGTEYRRTKGDPTDIIVVSRTGGGGGEESADVTSTVTHLIKGARVRQDVEDAIVAGTRYAVENERSAAVQKSYEARLEAEKKIGEIEGASIAVVHAWSPLLDALTKANDTCRRYGARMYVVALPLDVQVSDAEFGKYGVPPVDVSETKVLVDDVIETSEVMHVSALDATNALRGAEPGAFLNGDLHMTPKGHRAVAEAINALLDSELPSIDVIPTVPEGRTHVPGPAEWAAEKAIDINHDTVVSVPDTIDDTPKGERAVWKRPPPPGCEAKRIHEWIRVVCAPVVRPGAKASSAVTGVRRTSPESQDEVYSFANGQVAMVLAGAVVDEKWPHFEDDEGHLKVEFTWADATRTLDVGWIGANSEWTFDFSDPSSAPSTAPAPTDGADRVCACAKEVDADATCASVIGAPDRDCARTYPTDCARLLACVRGERGSPPECLPGWKHAGAALRCWRGCSDERKCEVGACAEWSGVARICR